MIVLLHFNSNIASDSFLTFHLLYMCIKIDLICIAVFVTRRSSNTSVEYTSDLFGRQYFAGTSLPVSVRSSVCLSVCQVVIL